MSRVYLAGTMGGLTLQQADTWRQNIIDRLANYGVIGVSPTRWLKGMDPGHVISMHGNSEEERAILEENMLTNDPSLAFEYDRLDIMNSDVMVANLRIPSEVNPLALRNAQKPSIGTVSEITMAWENDIPVVAIGGNGDPYDHLFIHKMVESRVMSLHSAAAEVINILRQKGKI